MNEQELRQQRSHQKPYIQPDQNDVIYLGNPYNNQPQAQNPQFNQPQIQQDQNIVGNRYMVMAPGYAGQWLNIGDLFQMVKSGILKPNMMVQTGRLQHPVRAADIPTLFSNRDYTIAVLVSFLFGWLGADRFYMGHVGLGILKFFTLGAFGFWWFVDLILVATKAMKDSDGRPLA